MPTGVPWNLSVRCSSPQSFTLEKRNDDVWTSIPFRGHHATTVNASNLVSMAYTNGIVIFTSPLPRKFYTTNTFIRRGNRDFSSDGIGFFRGDVFNRISPAYRTLAGFLCTIFYRPVFRCRNARNDIWRDCWREENRLVREVPSVTIVDVLSRRIILEIGDRVQWWCILRIRKEESAGWKKIFWINPSFLAHVTLALGKHTMSLGEVKLASDVELASNVEFFAAGSLLYLPPKTPVSWRAINSTTIAATKTQMMMQYITVFRFNLLTPSLNWSIRSTASPRFPLRRPRRGFGPWLRGALGPWLSPSGGGFCPWSLSSGGTVPKVSCAESAAGLGGRGCISISWEPWPSLGFAGSAIMKDRSQAEECWKKSESSEKAERGNKKDLKGLGRWGEGKSRRVRSALVRCTGTSDCDPQSMGSEISLQSSSTLFSP